MPDPKSKPKFDPTKGFDTKPAFDPSKGFDPVIDPPVDYPSNKLATAGGILKPAGTYQPEPDFPGSISANQSNPNFRQTFVGTKPSDKGDIVERGYETTYDFNPLMVAPPERKSDKVLKMPKTETQGWLLNTVSALDRGFYKNIIGNPVKGLGTLLEQGTAKITGGDGKAFISDALTSFGDYFNKAIDEVTPQDEEYKNSLSDQFSQAFGQVASLVLTAGTGGAAKGASALGQSIPKAATVGSSLKTIEAGLASPTAISAGLTMGQAEFDRAKSMGATDEQAFEAFYKNAAVGSILEKIPVMQFMKRFNQATAGGIGNYIKTKGVAGIVGGFEEMTTEVLQQLYANKTAGDIYNSNQDIFEGLSQNGGLGFGVGFLLNAMGANVKLLKKQGNVDAAEIIETQLQQFEKKSNGTPKQISQPIELNPEITSNATENTQAKNESNKGNVIDKGSEGNGLAQIEKLMPAPVEPAETIETKPTDHENTPEKQREEKWKETKKYLKHLMGLRKATKKIIEEGDTVDYVNYNGKTDKVKILRFVAGKEEGYMTSPIEIQFPDGRKIIVDGEQVSKTKEEQQLELMQIHETGIGMAQREDTGEPELAKKYIDEYKTFIENVNQETGSYINANEPTTKPTANENTPEKGADILPETKGTSVVEDSKAVEAKSIANEPTTKPTTDQGQGNGKGVPASVEKGSGVQPAGEPKQTPATKKAVEEIGKLNLTHVESTGMGAKQAEGMYVSTESGNRYSTKDNPGKKVAVKVENPKVTDYVENTELQKEKLGDLVKNEQITIDDIAEDKLADLETYTGKKANDITPKDIKEWHNVALDGKVDEDVFNQSARTKAAKLITEQYKAEGYDALYFPETKTQEGELVVFDRNNVTITEEKSNFKNDGKEKPSAKEQVVAGDTGQSSTKAGNSTTDTEKIKVYKKRKKPEIKSPLYIKALDLVDDRPIIQVLQHFIRGGKISDKALQEFYGRKGTKLIQGELNSKISLRGKDGAKTIDELAHKLWDELPEELRDKYTTIDFREAVEDVLLNHNSKTKMAEEVLKLSEGALDDVDIEMQKWYEQHYEGMQEKVPEEVFDNAIDILEGLSDTEILQIVEMEEEALNNHPLVKEAVEQSDTLPTQEVKDNTVQPNKEAEIKKLEQDRDEKIQAVGKPAVKLNLLQSKDLANSADPIGNKEIHDDIKDRYKKLKKIAACL